MRVSDLIEHLKMFGEDTEVYLQTVPEDFATPVQRKNISLVPAHNDERYGLQMQKIFMTVIPDKQDS